MSLSVLGADVDKTAESDFLQNPYSGVKGRATSHTVFFAEMIFRSAGASCTTSGEPARTYTRNENLDPMYTGIYAS